MISNYAIASYSSLLVISLVASAVVIAVEPQARFATEADMQARNVREQDANRIRQERATLIAQLIQDAREQDQGWYGAKHLAILLLGDLRAEEAVSVLIENVDYKQVKHLGGSIPSLQQQYPAVESLIKIGLPAISLIEKSLASAELTIGERENFIHIYLNVLGPQLAVIKLRMAASATKDDASRANLLHGIKLLEEKGREIRDNQLK